MKTALILTTINTPYVLALYRRLDPSVRFFVACDEKTPKAAYDFCASIPDCEAYSPDRQKELGWECSPLIGWNTVARRNIALLKALKWGAELIVSVDDDNIPIDAAYFTRYFELLDDKVYFDDPATPPVLRLHPWSGLKVAGSGWFDPGQLQFPTSGAPVCQRGFPQQLESWSPRRQAWRGDEFEPVVNASIGVAQGAVLGDPDTSAIDRISRHPTVHQVSEILRAGVVSDPRTTWAPLNAQNIAFLRELAPCFLMVPQFFRYDDIFSGLVAQRVMRERNLFVHYGRPFVWQQRNSHDLVKDLKAELWGMEHVVEFADWLARETFAAELSPLDMVRLLWKTEKMFRHLPSGVAELGEAWCRDCERATA